MVENTRAVAVLVHGTSAQDADWIKEGSKLRTALEQALPGLIHFEKFIWTGKNSLAGRHDATEKLSKFLQYMVNNHSSKKLFVIGHSHGGNVALKAVELAGLFKEVNVACLSTPFFHITPKLYTEELVQHIAGGLATVVAVCTLTIWWITQKYLPWWLQKEWTFFAMMALISTVSIIQLRKPLLKWKNAARKKAATTRLDVPPVCQIIIVA